MKLLNILKKATEFGTLSSRDNFFSFALKIVFYIIPAIFIGNYTDSSVKKLKEQKILGEPIFLYIILQTFIIVATLYLLVLFLSDYLSEFQVTVAGGYFIVLYFGIQTNYMDMFKEAMD